MQGLRRRNNNSKNNNILKTPPSSGNSIDVNLAVKPLKSNRRRNKKKKKKMWLKKFWKGSYTRLQVDAEEVLGGCPQCFTEESCVLTYIAKTPHLCLIPVPCCLGVARTERVQCLDCGVVFDSPEEYRGALRSRQVDVEAPSQVVLLQNASIKSNTGPDYEKGALSLGITSTSTSTTSTQEEETEQEPSKAPSSIEQTNLPPPPSKIVVSSPPPLPQITDEYILQHFISKGHFAEAEQAARTLLLAQPRELTTLCLLDMALNGQGKTVQAEELTETQILPKGLGSSHAFPRLMLQTPDYKLEAKQYFEPTHSYYVFHVTSAVTQNKRIFQLQRSQKELVVLKECLSDGQSTTIVSGTTIPNIQRVTQDVLDYLAVEACWQQPRSQSPVEVELTNLPSSTAAKTVPLVV